jgi:putative colanic acid biosynthesis acetyltransferase WcaF
MKPATPDLLTDRRAFDGPTFSLSNRLRRLAWQLCWLLLARWTPPQARLWRLALLKAFGAQVSWRANVYPSVKIWAPWHLEMAPLAALAPRVEVYNIAPISIGEKAIVSQGAYLCTGTHDHRDPAFPLYARPIQIGRRAWVCAEAFVGPGVIVGEGAVLAARGVSFKPLAAWTVYQGNPATAVNTRPPQAN